MNPSQETQPDKPALDREQDLDASNNDRDMEVIEEPEFFLGPILATDPLPYLFDPDGHPIDADGRLLLNDGNSVPEAIRELQRKARPHRNGKGS